MEFRVKNDRILLLYIGSHGMHVSLSLQSHEKMRNLGEEGYTRETFELDPDRDLLSHFPCLVAPFSHNVCVRLPAHVHSLAHDHQTCSVAASLVILCALCFARHMEQQKQGVFQLLKVFLASCKRDLAMVNTVKRICRLEHLSLILLLLLILREGGSYVRIVTKASQDQKG